MLWVSVGILLAISALVTFRISGEVLFVTTGFVLGIATTLVPLGVKAGYLIFRDLGRRLDVFLTSAAERPSEVFSELLDKRLRQTSVVYVSGAAFGLLALVAFTEGGAFEFGPKAPAMLRVQMGITIGAAGVAAGIGLGLIIILTSIVSELDRFEVKLAPHKFGICAVGNTVLKIYMLTAAIWFVFSCSAVVGLRDIVTPLISLAGLTLVLFLVSFPVCLMPLHRRMVGEKAVRVVQRYESWERLSEKPIGERNEQHFRMLSEAKREYEETLALPEWPFGWKTALAIATSGVVSNLPAIASFVAAHFFGKSHS